MNRKVLGKYGVSRNLLASFGFNFVGAKISIEDSAFEGLSLFPSLSSG